jgi:superfamily II DNA or RNA helicase
MTSNEDNSVGKAGQLTRKQIRGLIVKADGLRQLTSTMSSAVAAAQANVDASVDASRRAQALAELADMPIESLRPLVTGRIAWSALVGAGVVKVADAYLAGRPRLEAVHGVGPLSADEISWAAGQVFEETLAQVKLEVTPDSSDGAIEAVVTSLVALDDLTQATRTILPAAQDAVASATNLVELTEIARGRLRWWFAGGERRQRARDAAGALFAVLEAPALASIWTTDPAHWSQERVTAGDARARFASDPARYLSLLDSRVGSLHAASGDLDSEIVQRIEAIDLDTSLLAVMLRRYQAFGAQFVLAQNRVILGDDMGLGKTIQALAVMSHLAAQASRLGTVSRFLVVAPASVLVNWEREVSSKSDLPAHVLHGSRDPGALDTWHSHGGVAVTTFEHTAKLELDTAVDLLVIDEAHYVKNPQAQRTQRIADLVTSATRVMMMTGTPIENRASEFVDLITMINPALGASLVESTVIVNPAAFRRLAAPVYLRRNADDVLTELPARIEIDEWEEMTEHDEHAYRQALVEGNFMAIRRAGFAAAGLGRSAKLTRLRELVDEARAGGHKVIAYSYFLEVLDTVVGSLAEPVFGPLTGAMRPQARQELVDAFTAAPAGAVLVAQVIAGGVGMNIQAASVVIMCEPQLKPSTENQAIARAHRMGQLKPVQVHRLLNPDSIDERIEELLQEKAGVFSEYARDSELASAADGAVDSRVALKLIQGERDRLGVARESADHRGDAPS